MPTYKDDNGEPIVFEYRPDSKVVVASHGDLFNIQISEDRYLKLVHEPMLIIPTDVLLTVIGSVHPVFEVVIDLIRRGSARGACGSCNRTVVWYPELGAPLTGDGKLACSECISPTGRDDFARGVREMLLSIQQRMHDASRSMKPVV